MMKNLLLLTLLLVASVAFSQKIEVAQGNPEPMVGVNVFVLATEIDFDKKYLIDMGDGQQFVLENNKTIEGRSEAVKHKYTETKSYILKLQEVDESGAFKIIDMQNLKINAKPTKLIIQSVVLKKYPPVKEDGMPWDNTFASTFPDLYISVYHGQTLIIDNINDNIANVKRENLPLELLKAPITIDIPEKENIQILIYDMDSVTDHDYMGGIAMYSNVTQLISLGGFIESEHGGEDFKMEVKFTLE